MDEQGILLGNVLEFIREARKAKERGSFNSATTLFFKALAVLTDLFILRKEGFIPNNHTERFKLLKAKYPVLYRIIDKDFPLYQDSYRLRMTKKTVEVLEHDITEAAKITCIEISS